MRALRESPAKAYGDLTRKPDRGEDEPNNLSSDYRAVFPLLQGRQAGHLLGKRPSHRLAYQRFPSFSAKSADNTALFVCLPPQIIISFHHGPREMACYDASGKRPAPNLKAATECPPPLRARPCGLRSPEPCRHEEKSGPFHLLMVHAGPGAPKIKRAFGCGNRTHAGLCKRAFPKLGDTMPLDFQDDDD